MGIRLQPARMQSSGHPHYASSMEDPRLHRTRERTRGRIIDLLRRRHQQPINDVLLNKFRDIARRLDEGLFKTSRTKEEYMNLGTLDQRLRMLVQRIQQRRQNVN